MFDLEGSISEWRKRMVDGGIGEPEVPDELEGHLREDVQSRVKAGSCEQDAFEAAVQQIGRGGALRSEFMKAGAGNWNLPLAYAAWTIYVVSFFLPALDGGFGWQCAILQKEFWRGAIRGHWPSIHYELLTLANLLMIASPFLLSRFALNPRALAWLQHLTLTAALLVWSYIGLFFVLGGWEDLRVGCFAWATSFGLLVASMARHRERIRQYV